MIKLSVNLNKIALIRNSREGSYPSVVKHAKVCIDAGCDGITVHPRPDQRHIRPSDVYDLAELTQLQSNIEFNIEGNPFAEPQGQYPGLIPLVLATNPDQCTLVPDNNNQLTSDHGFDLKTEGDRLGPLIRQLQDQGIRVSLFMDPDPKQIALAAELGADRVELYTGPYAESWNDKTDLAALFPHYQEAAIQALKSGVGLNAGHDLNLHNLAYFAHLPGLQEVSIGHALIVDAIDKGLATTVKAYKTLLQNIHGQISEHD